MALYLVERRQTGISVEQLVKAQGAAIEMSQRFTAKGNPAYYIRTTFVPSASRCLTLFEALNGKVVQEVHEAAQIPFDRVIEAVELIPLHIESRRKRNGNTNSEPVGRRSRNETSTRAERRHPAHQARGDGHLRLTDHPARARWPPGWLGLDP